MYVLGLFLRRALPRIPGFSQAQMEAEMNAARAQEGSKVMTPKEKLLTVAVALNFQWKVKFTSGFCWSNPFFLGDSFISFHVHVIFNISVGHVRVFHVSVIIFCGQTPSN